MTAPDRDLHLARWTPDPAHDPSEPWVSPVVEVGFDVASALPSWSAETPEGAWVDVAVRRGPDDPWYMLARWSSTHQGRTTFGRDTDGLVRRHDDELVVDVAAGWRTAQLSLAPFRTGDGAWPRMRSASLLLSGEAVAEADAGTPSGVAHAVDLPAYSQQLHRDLTDHPGGGGRAWCSPTAVSMVLDHWGAGPPTPSGGSTRDDVVPLAAAAVFDSGYAGTGNWAFNTAYAAGLGVDAFVTRLRSLEEAELFTRAGIPLVISMVFGADELDGAGFDTQGHLMVLHGFDAAGDVLVHDPASHLERSNDAVPRTYRRDQVARAWLGRASGVAYVLHPADVPLPAAPAGAAW
ncbi:C39 family peptidase [Solicola sp. PLA-1-18]|uniref:C39 family peptidase n=1 Tax=Solicola sp. PLA-1-18 TaxID=3380532 RepID=UPI003B7B3FBA